MRRSEKAEYWRGKIRDQESSGLRVTAFCRKHGLSAGTFAWWKHQLRNKEAEGAAHRATAESASGGFMELLTGGGAVGQSGVELLIGGRLIVRLARGFDCGTLKTLLSAVADERG
jgi:hypothetical protein